MQTDRTSRPDRASAHARRRRYVSGASRIGVAVVSMLAMLALLELGTRWVVPPPAAPFARSEGPGGGFDWRDPMPYVVFAATPDADVRIAEGAWVTLQAPPGGAAHVVTDAHGFRYEGDLSVPKEPGELRIFLLGGSVTVLGLSNESTICGELERAIAARLAPDRRVRCVSAGIMTGVSDQELARLVHHVARLAPDIVISLSGFNDAVARRHFDPRLGAPAPWFVYETAYREKLAASRDALREVAALPAWKLLLSRSRIATTLWPGLALHQLVIAESIEHEFEDQERSPTSLVVEHFLGNWDLMDRISRAVGAHFVGILQPCRPQERRAGGWDEFYQLAGAAIARRATNGAAYYSLDGLFDDRPEIFYDPIHTFDTGHPIFAARILEILVAQGLLEPASPLADRSTAPPRGPRVPSRK